MNSGLRGLAMPAALLVLTAAAALYAAKAGGYAPFVLAMVALTAIVGVGLNILVGLTGQISLGHVGFYAIGAYTVAILSLQGVSFWIALPLAGLIAGAIGLLLSLPALRVTGPYLAMVTIAFAFIVQHLSIEWRALTGGSNGLMGLAPPSIGGVVFTEREMALLAIIIAGASMLLFHRLAGSAWGKAMVAVRDAEVAARSIGLNPVSVKAAAFMLSAVFRRHRRRHFCLVAGVRGAGLVSVLAIDPVLVRLRRRRRGVGAGTGGRRRHHRRIAGAAVESGGISVAVLRHAAAGGALAGAGRHPRHLCAAVSPARSARRRCEQFRCRGIPCRRRPRAA